MAINIGLDVLFCSMYDWRGIKGKGGEVNRRKSYGPITNDEISR
jgi:hypothetical protein